MVGQKNSMPKEVREFWKSHFGPVQADPNHPAFKNSRQRIGEAEKEASIEEQQTFKF
jgi:hypothetical protein